MNIKSFLLGSAAALVAVSGAHAADAVTMVEPEPVEYVRICDVYGAGYFYIPGSETCLKISGYVRMRVQARDKTTNSDLNNPGDDYNVGTRVRARVQFDAREETELGTLRSFVRLQATNNGAAPVGTSGNDVNIDQAFLQIGGLFVGKYDSLWAADDGGITDGLYTDNDWSVGDLSTNRISYTYAANGFSASVSAEDDGSGDFMPDILGKLTYTGGWGGAYILGVYDEQAGNSTTTPYSTSVAFNGVSVDLLDSDNRKTDDGAFALKAGLELKDLIAKDGSLKIEGSYAFDPTSYTADTGGNYLVKGSNFFGRTYGLSSQYQIGAGYTQKFGKLTAILSGVYGKTFDITSVALNRSFDGADYYGVAGNLGYAVTKNLSLLGEVSYRNIDFPTGDFKQTAGFLEIKRSF